MERALLAPAQQRPGRVGGSAARGPRVPPIAASILVLFVAACASIGSKFDAPQVSVESVRVLRIVEQRAEISVKLKLVNPNDVELAVTGLEYAITLDGRLAASGRTTRVDTLPPHGEGTVEIAGRVDTGAVATAMMALSSQIPVQYTLAGQVTLQNGVSLPFSRKGDIAISKDAALGPRPR